MGMSYIQIFPSFGATGLTLIAFFELVSVMYVYGHKRFTDDIENMTGGSFNVFLALSWLYSFFRCATGSVLADNVEIHLASVDVGRHRLLHLLHADQQPQVLGVEQGTGETRGIQFPIKTKER